MNITEDKKVELYYDHYKDTFQQQIRYIDNRNKYFLSSLVLITLLFLTISEPVIINQAIGSIVKKEIGDNIIFDYTYINNFLLFTLLWVLILYYQMNLIIEKQYKYLRMLEDYLSDIIQPFPISREGKFWSEIKPTFSKIISKLYKVFFPLSVVISVFIKLMMSIIYFSNFSRLTFWIDIILCLLIISITLFYIYWQQIERKKIFNKTHKINT